MKTCGIDTNILLRWLVDESIWPVDNRAQADSAEQLLLDETKTIFINALVVHEAIWLLHRRAKQPKSVIIEILDHLYAATHVQLQHREAFLAARDIFASSKCEFCDCLIAEINAHEGCETTYTFDKTASKAQGFTLLG